MKSCFGVVVRFSLLINEINPKNRWVFENRALRRENNFDSLPFRLRISQYRLAFYFRGPFIAIITLFIVIIVDTIVVFTVLGNDWKIHRNVVAVVFKTFFFHIKETKYIIRSKYYEIPWGIIRILLGSRTMFVLIIFVLIILWLWKKNVHIVLTFILLSNKLFSCWRIVSYTYVLRIMWWYSNGKMTNHHVCRSLLTNTRRETINMYGDSFSDNAIITISGAGLLFVGTELPQNRRMAMTHYRDRSEKRAT